MVIGDVSWHPVMYGPNEQSRALNIGVALDPDARGHGFGTEAQRLLAELLLEQFEVERIEASTDVDNSPSSAPWTRPDSREKAWSGGRSFAPAGITTSSAIPSCARTSSRGARPVRRAGEGR